MREKMLAQRIIGAACAGLLGLLIHGTAEAQSGGVYYVSTSGSDGNPGTYGKPWRHIQYAANTVSAGATVYVFGGVYNEVVSFPRSGTSSAPITFESYPGQTAVLDGTGIRCCGPSGTEGLFTISGSRSYITVSGFEVRNLTTSGRGPTPAGIWVTGSGNGVHILNNLVHNITTTAARGNAFGISVYGTSKTPLTQIVISGNEVYDLLTGQSESVNVDGNVTHYTITNNLVHDNDNIGIAAIGYDNAGPVGYDEAMYGEISGNTVYNISGITNKGEGQSYDADGIYCDGCAYVTIENNWVFNADLGIEVTSENQFCQPNGTEWSGPSGTGNPGKGKSPCYGRYATVRNNVFSDSENAGLSIGGAAAASAKGGSETLGGSTLDAVFVNNTLYNNVKQTANDRQSAPGGEIQIQHQIGSAQDDYFENNLVYAGTWNHWIYSYVKSSAGYPAPPATDNWNLFYSGAGYAEGKSVDWDHDANFKNFAAFQSATGEDANSLGGVNPDVGSVTSTPTDLDIAGNSPAVNAGSTTLSCSVGWCDPNGNSPHSIYGATDFLGNPRTNGSTINIGAYEVTGIASNTVSVSLTASPSALRPPQSTTLLATVTAVPAGGGVPSGTVAFMQGSQVLGTQTLLPIGVSQSAASQSLSGSKLFQDSKPIVAVYSGNSIAIGCCSPSSPPGGGTQVPIYSSAVSPPLMVTCAPSRSMRGAAGQPYVRRANGQLRHSSLISAPPC
jgi:hypothetical protein